MLIKSLNQYKHPRNFPFWIQRNRHDERDMPLLHGHEFVELIYVAKGQATHLFQDISYEIGEGDVFIINPGEKHGYVIGEGQSIQVINCLFEPGFIPIYLLRELRLSDSLDFFYVQPFLNRDARFYHKLNLRGVTADKTKGILEELHHEMVGQSPGFQALVQLRMTELFILLSRYYNERKNKADKRSPSELLVRRVCGYVERHYNQKITLPLLSELFYIGVRQLNRHFNRHIGSSVIEYVHRIRMEKAKRLLVETDEKINVVAELVGYEDAASFSRSFTREVGRSPGKYRELNR
ncbi:helix-turn-helix domain-containing protein [Paenibacillus hemerocallicola]|uniref:Helix-turn-helix domain-containing protein n=1 Tax=Paenibacillus hemerocallicola TaxID=1172614 RepID=A0A5C4T3S5_9BACL|nr:AraC family transcriptional regulator [Paenibacillus hemerocallicola]TNJ63714.1 helix-turn-helix domain-containing protein [Paenibacillus hemerocallicola]